MFFRDEFEYETNDGMFHVEVEGLKFYDDYDKRWYTEIRNFFIHDDSGAQVDNMNPNYNEILEEIHSRDYEVEEYEYEDNSYD